MMKIVIAPDSFKESLSAMDVATCIESGFSQIFPDSEYIKIPLADGGEGTVDVLVEMLEGEKQYCDVHGPITGNVNAMWALLHEGQRVYGKLISPSTGGSTPSIPWTAYGTSGKGCLKWPLMTSSLRYLYPRVHV